MNRQSKNRGFSLIEVMVTLLLLTVGMLGLVVMQGRGIQYTTDAAQRNNALMLANEAMEMIRANPDQAASYNFLELPADVDCETNIPASEVNKQLGCWAKRARILLPDAEALKAEFRICRSNAPKTCDAGGAAYMVQVAWRAASDNCMDDSPEAGNDPSICRLHLQGEL
jgi:type IV pilus assembly protein PilV